MNGETIFQLLWLAVVAWLGAVTIRAELRKGRR